MSHPRIALIVLLTTVLALGACGGGVLKMGWQDVGTTIELRQGEQAELVLEGNVSTGFSWEIETLDQKVLQLSGEPVYVSDGTMPGSPGHYTFRFEAVAAGQTTLRLIYHRPFEKDVPPAQTFELTVVVK